MISEYYSLLNKSSIENSYNMRSIPGDMNKLPTDELCQIIAQENFEVNAIVDDAKGWTPLMYAIVNNRLEVIICLIDRGADVNHRGVFGCTPLHLAASKIYVKIVELLLSRGADCMALDADKKHPLSYLEKAKGFFPTIDFDDIFSLLTSNANFHAFLHENPLVLRLVKAIQKCMQDCEWNIKSNGIEIYFELKENEFFKYNCQNTLHRLCFLFSGVDKATIIIKQMNSSDTQHHPIGSGHSNEGFIINQSGHMNIFMGKRWRALTLPQKYRVKAVENIRLATQTVCERMELKNLDLSNTSPELRQNIHLESFRRAVKSINMERLIEMENEISDGQALNETSAKVYYVTLFKFNQGHAFTLVQLNEGSFVLLQSWQKHYHLLDWLMQKKFLMNFEDVCRMLTSLKLLIIQDEWRDDSFLYLQEWFEPFPTGPTVIQLEQKGSGSKTSFMVEGLEFQYFSDQFDLNILADQSTTSTSFFHRQNHLQNHNPLLSFHSTSSLTI